MSNTTLKEAINLTGKSESTLRRDMRSGKVSYSKNETGRLEFDSAELVRVYGQLKPVDTANDTTNDREMNGNDTPKIIALLENQVTELKSQLENATAERSKLLDLTDRLQKQTELLMLPPAPQKRTGFLKRLQQIFTD